MRLSRLTIIVASLLAAIALTGCGSSSSPAALKRAASRCPIAIEGVGFISSIELHADTLVYLCSVTDPGINLTALRSDSDAMKRTMLPSITTLFTDDPALLDELRNRHWILSIRYSAAGGASLVLDFTPDELTAGSVAAGADISPGQRLADEIRISNASLPVDMTDGITMVSVVDDGTNVVFDCSVDEAAAGPDAMDALRANISQIRAEMSRMLLTADDPDIVRLVDLTTAASRGIAYRYTGSLSADTLSIVFTPADLVR